MAESRARLFVAVEIPARVRGAVEAAARPLRLAQPHARWVDPSALHLTVAFVGEVGDDERRAVESACAEAAATVGTFDLALSGRAGTFGRGVLWAGVENSPALDRLATAVRGALVARGLPGDDRPFHAHVTLARAGRATRIRPRAAEDYDSPRLTWRVEHLVLMRSRLGQGGARYRVAGEWPLEGDGDAAATAGT